MKKQWKRLLIAALSSSSVFAMTWFWYQSSDHQLENKGNEKPIAYVGKVSDDIQRRPASRLLWQLVNTGEPLYDGEAIRTSPQGEVRILFADSDRYLDLEPESLIVIKKSQGEIALDLMEGSLFVNANTAASTAGPGLVLNSAKGKVDLSKASVSLSKGQGESVDVQVLTGKASLQGANGENRELGSDNDIRILTPSLQKPITVNGETQEAVLFQWQGFPTNTQVTLWLGANRKNMKEIKTADLNSASLLTKLPSGRQFWKLVAKSADGKTIKESAVYRSEIVPRYAPTLVYPTADAEVPAFNNPASVEFKWQTSADVKQITLDIWSDDKLSQKITSKIFTKEDSFKLPALKHGAYFWRMSASYADSEKPIIGKVQKFVLKPSDQVSIQSLAKEQIKVDFTMPEADLTQYYIDKPQLGLTWQSSKDENVATWRLRILEENADPSAAQQLTSTEKRISAPVTKPGRYIASVEALDKYGSVLGTSPSQALTLAALPLLPAPQLNPADGPLQATRDGRSTLQWGPVPQAKEYWLTIRKDGKELRKSRSTTTSLALKNLLPGEYEVEISATDAYGRQSEPGTPRKLVVPETSGVKAPVVRKIKVN